jgi:hypothetical protein
MNSNDIITEAFVAKEIIGIDPGKSNGGVVKFNGERYETWPIKKMKTFEDMCDFFKYQAEICKMPLIFLEKITSFQGDFNDPNMKGRIFRMNKLKDHFVELKSAIKVSGINYIEIMPASWQKYLKIHQKGEEYKERKERYKDIAIDWFKGNKVVNWNADAFLIVEFGRTKLKYEPNWIHNRIKEFNKKKLF